MGRVDERLRDVGRVVALADRVPEQGPDGEVRVGPAGGLDGEARAVHRLLEPLEPGRQVDAVPLLARRGPVLVGLLGELGEALLALRVLHVPDVLGDGVDARGRDLVAAHEAAGARDEALDGLGLADGAAGGLEHRRAVQVRRERAGRFGLFERGRLHPGLEVYFPALVLEVDARVAQHDARELRGAARVEVLELEALGLRDGGARRCDGDERREEARHRCDAIDAVCLCVVCVVGRSHRRAVPRCNSARRRLWREELLATVDERRL